MDERNTPSLLQHRQTALVLADDGPSRGWVLCAVVAFLGLLAMGAWLDERDAAHEHAAAQRETALAQAWEAGHAQGRLDTIDRLVREGTLACAPLQAAAASR